MQRNAFDFKVEVLELLCCAFTYGKQPYHPCLIIVAVRGGKFHATAYSIEDRIGQSTVKLIGFFTSKAQVLSSNTPEAYGMNDYRKSSVLS